MALSEVESSSSSSSRANTNSSTGSAPKKCGEAFYLAKTVLRGSFVRQAVRGHLRSSSSCDIVLGKETSIELVTINGDGIVQSISEQPVFGTIKDLAILPWTKRFLTRDVDLAIPPWTKRFPWTLQWEAGPLAHHVVEVPNSQGFAFLFRAGDIVLMDFRNIHSPSCVYRASLSFSPVEDEAFENVGLPDIMDEEGIYSVAASALLELSEVNKSDDPMNIDDYNNVKPGANYVCSWCWEPDHTNVPRIIFSADSGDIYAIEVLFEPDGVKVNLSECLFKGQPSSVMIWLDGDFLAAIVDMGDGMVLKFEGGLLQYQSPIQITASILDMCAVDYSDEKHDQMFACSGMASEGSLRIIRSGISVEKLLKTAPIYHCVTGTWSVRMKIADTYHSSLVLSFVEETRVLSVGVSFSDVTDSVGYQPDVCTLACGLVADGVMVQIHQYGVRLCSPIRDVHPEGIPLSSPICTFWSPDNMKVLELLGMVL